MPCCLICYKIVCKRRGIRSLESLVSAVQTESGKLVQTSAMQACLQLHSECSQVSIPLSGVKGEYGKLILGSIFKLLHRKRQITKHTPHRFAELPYLKGAPYRL